MQLVQLFASAGERVDCLRCVEAHLRPGGIAALAIVELMPEPQTEVAPLPDVREVDGWVYSSLPIETGVDADSIVVRRLRQTVSPDGELSDEVDEIRLVSLGRRQLEPEAVAAGH